MQKVLLGLLLLVCAAPAGAETPPLPLVFKGHYHVSWNGIPVGALTLEWREDRARYRARADTKSSGLARIFVKHRSTSVVEGTHRGGQYKPAHYHSDYTIKKKAKSVELIFGANGEITKIVNSPESHDVPVTPVKPEALQGAIDPVTLAVAAGHAARRGNFTLRLFDGKRLSEVKGTVRAGNATVPGIGNTVGATLARTPLAGFDRGELEDAKKDATPDFYFARVGTPFLAAASMPLYGMRLNAKLTASCLKDPCGF